MAEGVSQCQLIQHDSLGFLEPERHGQALNELLGHRARTATLQLAVPRTGDTRERGHLILGQAVLQSSACGIDAWNAAVVEPLSPMAEQWPQLGSHCVLPCMGCITHVYTAPAFQTSKLVAYVHYLQGLAYAGRDIPVAGHVSPEWVAVEALLLVAEVPVQHCLCKSSVSKGS